MRLALRGLRYRYPGGVKALNGVDLELAPGDFCALVGANGSGKSTCLALAALMLKPDMGRVELFGRAWSSPRQVASRIAWMDQRTRLDPTMSGIEHLHLQAALMGLSRSSSAKRLAALVEGFRLENAVLRRVSSYSGGMRRRLHLALGLVHYPQLLLLDEPTAGLDPEGRALVWQYLLAQADAGETVLIATHDLVEVLKYANKLVFLEEGKVIAAGAPHDLARVYDGDLMTAYSRLSGRDRRELLEFQSPRVVESTRKRAETRIDGNGAGRGTGRGTGRGGGQW